VISHEMVLPATNQTQTKFIIVLRKSHQPKIKITQEN